MARKKKEGTKLGRPKGGKSDQYKLSGKEEQIRKLLQEKKIRLYISKKLGVNRQTLRDFMRMNLELD